MQFSTKPLREQIFTSSVEKRFFSWYHRIFSIEEIEQSIALKWFFGATLLSFLATFHSWIGRGVLTIQNYQNIKHGCWPWFPDCGKYFFFEMLPNGYSQTIFYMLLFGLMILIVYLMHKKEWILAHMIMVVLLAWKLLAGLLLTQQLFGNYDYYHVVFSIILLFFPLKLFFLKLSLVLFYVLAASAKFHETWILGTYFTALQAGLPIFPDWSMPFWTNLVTLMQIIGAWFLLSSNMFLQRTVLIFFVVFHLYSGVLVEYRYPLTVLPSLIILFGVFYTYQKPPLSKKSIIGWTLIVLLICLQFISVIIPGDERRTLEGNFYGLYMFEANHQCISEATIIRQDGSEETETRVSGLARNRCDPYRFWFRLNQICNRFPEVERINWTFDHSINGGAFYRIVDENNACELEYKALQHNSWIRLQGESENIGQPVKNVYF